MTLTSTTLLVDRQVDSVFHPFLPWVTDFRSRDGGWRDLTKSKFRLNKGDHQLDRTYETSSEPHHITERCVASPDVAREALALPQLTGGRWSSLSSSSFASLSEITYYIYMARRTPMPVLRHVVRSNFQPKEYPSSMARMYDWTPDECIPEFYTEPSVFTAIRGDVMEDLALPTWSVDAYDFVMAHRSMLESDAVSRELHHWIDLNFGVSLSGAQAIAHKNVPLKVGPREARLGKSPGFVQVFTLPHPMRQWPRRERGPDTDTSEPSEEATEHRVHVSFASTNGVNEKKADVDRMLSKALRIVSDACDGASASGLELPSSSLRVLQSRHSMTNLSLTADAKAQNQSSRAKAKRKQPKPRPRSHGSDPPVTSPPTSAKDDSSKSATVSRLATVIPNFFYPDASFGHSSGGHASSFKMGGDATPTATTPVAGSGPRSGSQFADNSLADNQRLPAPLIYGVAGDAGMQSHARTASTGAAATTSPRTTTSHIFRDLWQQLSKPDEADADLAAESSGHHHVLDTDWSDADHLERLDEMDLQLLSTGLPIKITSTWLLTEQETSVGDNRRSQRHTSLPVVTETPCCLTESSMSLETRVKLRRTSEAILDPVYSLPRESVATVRVWLALQRRVYVANEDVM